MVDCENKGEDQLFQAVDDTEADNADNDEDNDEDNDDDDNDDEAANGTLASNSWQLPLGRSKNRQTLIKFNQPATFLFFKNKTMNVCDLKRCLSYLRKNTQSTTNES